MCQCPFLRRSLCQSQLAEDGLHHASIPKLGLCAMCQAFLPLCGKIFGAALPVLALPDQVDEGEFLVTQRTLSLLAMKRALVEGA